MSCSSFCCCCVTPSRQGNRKGARLVREEVEGGGGRGGGRSEEEDEEQSRGKMDVSRLRAQYRSTRERQRRLTQVLLFRTVSEQLSEAVSIVPVTHGFTSSPPVTALAPDPTTYDPWHVHLGLHRRSCHGVTVQLPASSLETTNTDVNGSSRRSSSSNSLCSSFNTREEEAEDEDSPVQVSVSRSLEASTEQNPGDGSRENPPDNLGSLSSSGESPVPVTSFTGSPCSSNADLHPHLEKNLSAGVQVDDGVLQTRGPAAWRDVRKSSAPAALRFTRQLSVGGVGPSSWVHLNQDHYPFPNRRTPRISDAARRLGMYSSF
ncbi:uncharacterized protein LOC118290979 [Scophthalmus maximus]|uniref:uncharacterized protein LOC118290979 n=1 Tax=Scophthalmus maximus TaxID=52904 RepID=UPI0015E0B6B2|nr:uncharacterized protein LOC118290979 [Scophthalmus maximus]